MGQVKAYAQWAHEEGYLNEDYTPVDPNANSMDYVNKFIKVRDRKRSSSMASSHFNNATTIQLEDAVKIIHKKEKKCE